MSGTSSRFRGPAAEESVACNLIPMIDVMFLLLLFFMLGADMSQRELEELRLPKADRCTKDDQVATLGGRTTVNVFHARPAGGVNCAVHEAGGRCRDPSHWLLAIRASEFAPDEIALRMKEEAELVRPSGDAERDRAAPREVMIRADEEAPYAVVQKVIEGCAAAGLWKVEVGAARPSGD
jgi:biopolymer transport protein ExbD